MKKCMRAGHDWAYNVSMNTECLTAICLRCGAKQYFFIDEVQYEPNLDDDGPEE